MKTITPLMKKISPLLRSAAIVPAVIAQTVFSPVAAQTDASSDEPESVVTEASDAFGEQFGIDRVGLYSEVQVRGFDLAQSGGAYRIEDHYFARATGLSESLRQGSTVNVGIAATVLDLPSPSGVVSYRLREPGPTSGLEVVAGLRDFQTQYAEVVADFVPAKDRFTATTHFLLMPETHTAFGQDGDNYGVGTVLRWQSSPATVVRAFGGYQQRRYNGDFQILPAEDSAPPILPRELNYAPDGAQSQFVEMNAGILFDHDIGPWVFDGSLTYSAFEADRSDAAILTVDGEGIADSEIVLSPAFGSDAWAAEAKVARVFSGGAFDHRLGGAVRTRQTSRDQISVTTLNGGQFRLRDGPLPVAGIRAVGDGNTGDDTVTQTIASLSYGVEAWDRLNVRLGAHHSWYGKDLISAVGDQSTLTDERWFTNASAVLQLSNRAQLFASYATGLEESGVAPTSAVNVGDVLSPVEAEQIEIGASYRLNTDLTFVAAYFDIQKPIASLDGENRYRFVGDVRHSGVELSLAGSVGPDTDVVLGAVFLEPTLTGEQVESGVIGSTPPGVSALNTTVNVEHRFGDGWSVDLQYLYEGERRMTSTGQTDLDGIGFLTVGTRKAFTVGETPMSLRFQFVNGLDVEGYFATPYGVLAPSWTQTFRLSLAAEF